MLDSARARQDIANAALFLFSDAGNYINGTQIVVDGGAKHFPGPWLPYPDSSLDKQGELRVGRRDANDEEEADDRSRSSCFAGVKELVMGSKL